MTGVDPGAAGRFLETAFERRDWVAIFLKSYDRSGVAQRVGPVSWVQSERFQRWLRAMNARKYNVFVSVNAIASGRRSRTRDAIGAVRHVFLDADHDGSAVLSRVEARQDLPSPSYVLHSSPNRVHVFWRVTGLRLRLGRAIAEAACPRAADGSRSHAGDTEHPTAWLLQSQARPAPSRDDRLPERGRALRAGGLSASQGSRTPGLNRSVRTNRGTSICPPSNERSGTWRRCRRQLPVSTATSTRFASAVGSREDSRSTTTRRCTCWRSGTRGASRHGQKPSWSTSSVAPTRYGREPVGGLL